MAYYEDSGGELWIKVGITLVSVDNSAGIGGTRYGLSSLLAGDLGLAPSRCDSPR